MKKMFASIFALFAMMPLLAAADDFQSSYDQALQNFRNAGTGSVALRSCEENARKAALIAREAVREARKNFNLELESKHIEQEYAALVLGSRCHNFTLVSKINAAVIDDFKKAYDQAWLDFQNRGKGFESVFSCEENARRAADIAREAKNVDQEYDAFVLESRCTYFEGMLLPELATPDTAREAVFSRGMGAATKARNALKAAVDADKKNPNPKLRRKERAEAYYYLAINHGRRGLAQGVENSYKEKDILENEEADPARRLRYLRDGKMAPGRELDCYGPNRTIGYMYYALKTQKFGADFVKAETNLQDAYELCNINPNSADRPNSLNVLYYAEILDAVGKRSKAIQILRDLLKYEAQPEKYNPDRVPETIVDMKKAKVLLKSFGG